MRVIATAAIAAYLTMIPVMASAEGTYACDRAGGSQTRVDICGARWTAANLRAHLAVGAYGNSSFRCLANTAGLLDALAAKWEANGTETNPNFPCGKVPDIGNADDGLLAQACPNTTWTYANKGKVACNTSLPHLRALLAAAPPPQPATAPPNNPTRVYTGQGGMDSAYFGGGRYCTYNIVMRVDQLSITIVGTNVADASLRSTMIETAPGCALATLGTQPEAYTLSSVSFDGNNLQLQFAGAGSNVPPNDATYTAARTSFGFTGILRFARHDPNSVPEVQWVVSVRQDAN